jgi:hypothetical protein
MEIGTRIVDSTIVKGVHLIVPKKHESTEAAQPGHTDEWFVD